MEGEGAQRSSVEKLQTNHEEGAKSNQLLLTPNKEVAMQ